MHIPGQIKVVIAIILVTAGWFIINSTFSAYAYSSRTIQESANDHSMVQQQTATGALTPTPFPSEFTEQELEEGQPIGIIVGAVILVLVIILGTLLTLSRIKIRR